MVLAMAGAWVIQWYQRNAGWVDVVWSLGTGLIGFGFALFPLDDQAAITWRQMLVAILVLIWAARLAGYLAVRVKNGTEDERYAGLRTAWGGQFQIRLFIFLQIQALLSILLTVSIFMAAHRSGPLDGQDLLGLILLGGAILGEATADRQLKRFKASKPPPPRLCTVGLWRYSRHPNYFFEWLGWLAYPVMAVNPYSGHSWSLIAVLGPLLMYWILVKATGIPILERHMVQTRGDAYRRYQVQTSAFVPWPPRKEGE